MKIVFVALNTTPMRNLTFNCLIRDIVIRIYMNLLDECCVFRKSIVRLYS